MKTKQEQVPVSDAEFEALIQSLKRDKYDDAIDYLTAHPEEIAKAWMNPTTHKAGCLFYIVKPHETCVYEAPWSGKRCNCLTAIRFYHVHPDMSPAHGWTESLTRAIATDVRIPISQFDVKPEMLIYFAYWQRRIDRELHRQ